MARILITGGAGFIGSRLAAKLVQRSHEVTVLDSLTPQIHGANPDSSELYNSIRNIVNFQRGSVVVRNNLAEVLPNADCVVHFAAETGTGQSMYEIERYCHTNVMGTATLLDFIANEKNNVSKVVLASSRAIFGEGQYKCLEHGTVYPKERSTLDMDKGFFNCRCPICGLEVAPEPTDESAIFSPTSVYGITKLMQEQLVHNTCRALNIASLSLRYQNVYGPGQSLRNPYTGILSIFSNRLRKNGQINIFEDGLESRDFVHVEDVTDATVSSIELEGVINESLNIGTGESITVMQVADLLKAKYRSESEILVTGEYRKGDIRHNFANITKAKAVLGYTPKIEFPDGVQQFCDWVMTQPIEPDNYQNSLLELKKKGLFHTRKVTE